MNEWHEVILKPSSLPQFYFLRIKDFSALTQEVQHNPTYKQLVNATNGYLTQWHVMSIIETSKEDTFIYFSEGKHQTLFKVFQGTTQSRAWKSFQTPRKSLPVASISNKHLSHTHKLLDKLLCLSIVIFQSTKIQAPVHLPLMQRRELKHFKGLENDRFQLKYFQGFPRCVNPVRISHQREIHESKNFTGSLEQSN